MTSMAAVDAALALSSDDCSTLSQPVADTCTANDAKVSKLHCLLKRRLQLCATEDRIKIDVEDLIRKYRTQEQLTDSAAAVRGIANPAAKYSCYSTACVTHDGPGVAAPCYSPLCRHVQEQGFSCKLCLPEKLRQHLYRLSYSMPNVKDENLANDSFISHDSATENKSVFDSCDRDRQGGEEQSVDNEVSQDRKRLCDTTEELRLLVGLLQRHVRDGWIQLTEVLVSRLQSLLDAVTDTRNPVCLRGTVCKSGQKRTQIPVAHDFRTRSCRRSVFVLTSTAVRHLGRSGGMLFTIPGFSSAVSAKADSGWIYVSPRPLFCTAWKYRTASVRNLSAVALQLRVLWCCIRWDDMSSDSSLEDVTVAMESDVVTTTTILRRRDVGHDGLRSEYFVRRVSAPAAAGDDWHGNLHITIFLLNIDDSEIIFC